MAVMNNAMNIECVDMVVSLLSIHVEILPEVGLQDHMLIIYVEFEIPYSVFHSCGDILHLNQPSSSVPTSVYRYRQLCFSEACPQ